MIVVLDDSNEEPCEFPSKSMTFQLFPLDENPKKSTDITKLKLKCEVVFSEVIARFLDNNNCYFVVFDEKFRKDKTSDFCSFLVRLRFRLLISCRIPKCKLSNFLCDAGILKLQG